MASPTGDDFGRKGEKLAAQFLKRNGYKILLRNCRSRTGEIDLIARDGDEVVFVEVKTRTSRTWGDPESAVTPSKRRKLCLTAAAFADRHRLRDHALRFDVVAVVLAEGCEPEFQHFVNAFPFEIR